MADNVSMRLRVITTAAGLALVAGTALAQSPPTRDPGAGPMRPPNTAPRQAAPAPDPLSMEDVSKIKGAAVYDSTDKKIGSVSTVLMKPESKTIDRFVVGEGGVLGIGSHYVALPIDAFSWDPQKGGFRITKTADDLKSMPEWQQPQLSEAPTTRPPRPQGGSVGMMPPAGGANSNSRDQ